jgi:hypothetical protein
MNKKLLAAAIAAGLMIPGLAAADVKISGLIQAETGQVSVDNMAGVAAADTDSTVMGGAGVTASGALLGGGNNQLNFSGDEKLGNGMSAFFKIGWQFDTFDQHAGGISWNARDSFVGLKGDGWNVAFGRMNSGYKSTNMDPLNTTGLQARGIGFASDLHNGYADNWAQVVIGSGSVKGTFGMTWEDAAGSNGVNAAYLSDNVDAGSWAGNVEYKDKTWRAGIAASKNKYDTAAAGGQGDITAWKVYGSWSGNGFTVAGMYENLDASNNLVGNTRPDGGGDGFESALSNISGTVADAGDEYTNLMLAVTYKMSSATTLIGRYGNVDFNDSGAGNLDVDADNWVVAVVHGLSKRTEIYGGYESANYNTKGLSDADVDVWMIGMRHMF